MPLGDWQFWVVTVTAATALVIIARLFLPRRRPRRGTRVKLTVRESGGEE